MTQPTQEIADTLWIKTIHSLKIYSSPLRRRIMSTISSEPRSVNQIAALLNLPFTRLYYHLHILEQEGFIHMVETRHVLGGVEEKFYQVAARNFLVDRSLLNVNEAVRTEAFEAILNVTLRQAVTDIETSYDAGLIDITETNQTLVSIIGQARISKAHFAEFRRQLIALINEYEGTHDDTIDSAVYGFTAAIYPLRPDEPDPDSGSTDTSDHEK